LPKAITMWSFHTHVTGLQLSAAPDRSPGACGGGKVTPCWA
jgi:hypothetical protein